MFFVDAAHFVFGTFLCCLWSFKRIFVRAASGRQRFNVLGAWNAVTRELIAVTNTTVVNTETMCELLRKIAALGLTGPITLVLDNARYQRNAAVQALATQLGITLLYLPSYSPNLNLIERLWKFIKRRALYGRYHPAFAEFQAAINEVIDGLSTTHAESLESLMTLKFQRFEDRLTYGRVKYSMTHSKASVALNSGDVFFIQFLENLGGFELLVGFRRGWLIYHTLVRTDAVGYFDFSKGDQIMPARSILLGVSSSCADALDGYLFASIALDRGTLEWLKQRA